MHLVSQGQTTFFFVGAENRVWMTTISNLVLLSTKLWVHGCFYTKETKPLYQLYVFNTEGMFNQH